MKLAVTVPFFNEEKFLPKTLEALLAQTDQDFEAFFCDNNSTDRSAELVKTFIKKHNLKWHLVSEKQKGTGAAADTACRAAIAAAFDILARTDADGIPKKDWVERIRRRYRLTPNTAIISGLSIPIRSEVSWLNFWFYRFMGWFTLMYGVLRPSNYSKEMRSIHIMAAGNNMAISSKAYLQAGGFPRTRIEDAHEDLVLVNSARAKSLRIYRDRSVVVAVSARRVKAWGLYDSLQWYRTHRKPEQNVDIR